MLASYGIKNPVLSLFEEIPREFFVSKKYQQYAWEDRALPTDFGQTISQPSLVASTLQTADIKPEHKVMEIGTGSGYQAALLGRLAQKVYTLERFDKLAQIATQRLKKLGIDNVEVVTADGSEGWAKGAPYDIILVTATFYKVPQPLVDQLKIGGRLAMPIGREDWQQLMLFEKTKTGLKTLKKISDVRFVPFVGKHAWPPNPEERTQES